MGPPALTWVLQHRAINATDLEQLTTAIAGQGHRVETLQVIPFTTDPVGALPQIDGPCITYGSTSLLRLAHGQGWTPGGWDGDAFGADVMAAALGDDALNGAAVFCPFSQVAQHARAQGWARAFVRPVAETKEIAGQVRDLDDLEAWVAQLTQAEYFDAADNMFVVAPALELGREWRLFMVDGAVVTATQYANARQPDRAAGAPDAVQAFGRRIARDHAPAPCFVVDIAETTGGGLKAVEFNSINSSGLYRCDVAALVAALSAYVLKQGEMR